MTREDTLRSIKELESKIRTEIVEAKQQGEAILEDSREEAGRIVRRAEEEARGAYDQILMAAENPMIKDREEVIGVGMREAEEIRSRGKANMDRAVNFLMETFRARVG